MVKQYALLWSKKQGMPHIEPVERMLSNNRRAYTENRSNDYIPLAFGTLDEMSDAADAIRPTLIKRMPCKELALTL